MNIFLPFLSIKEVVTNAMKVRMKWKVRTKFSLFHFFLTYVLTSNTYTHEDHRYYINFTFPLLSVFNFLCVFISSSVSSFTKENSPKTAKFYSFLLHGGREKLGNYFILWQIFQWNVYCVWAFFFRESKRVFVKVFFQIF